MSKYKNWKPEAINCPTLHSQCQMMAFRILSINPRQNPRSRYDLEMFSYVLDDLDTISIFRNWLKRSRSRYNLHVYADFSNDPILSQRSDEDAVQNRPRGDPPKQAATARSQRHDRSTRPTRTLNPPRETHRSDGNRRRDRRTVKTPKAQGRTIGTM